MWPLFHVGLFLDLVVLRVHMLFGFARNVDSSSHAKGPMEVHLVYTY